MLKTVRKAEISDDHIAMAVEQEILEFEVSMNNFLLVDIPHTGNKLRKQLCCVSLTKIAVCENVVEKLSSGSIFDDDSYVLVGFDDIVQTDDIWVFEGLEIIGRRGE